MTIFGQGCLEGRSIVAWRHVQDIWVAIIPLWTFSEGEEVVVVIFSYFPELSISSPFIFLSIPRTFVSAFHSPSLFFHPSASGIFFILLLSPSFCAGLLAFATKVRRSITSFCWFFFLARFQYSWSVQITQFEGNFQWFCFYSSSSVFPEFH